MSFLSWTVFLFDIKGVTAVSVLLAPLLIVGIIILGLYLGLSNHIEVISKQSPKLVGDWFSSSMLYVSYNSIILIAILPNLLQYINSKRSLYFGSILGVGVLCFMALIIYSVTASYYDIIQSSQIPIIKIIKEQRLSIMEAYGIVLLAAMFTSAVSSGFCFLKKISDGKVKKMRIYAFVMCSLAIPISLVGFSGMIRWLYPIFGYIGLFQVVLVISEYLVNRKARNA
jgi:uncharacterized membrane protein YkvI